MTLRRTVTLAVIAAILGIVSAPPCRGEDQPQPTRKALVRVMPKYPELARNIHLSGTIRVLVTVAPNGNVKETKALGGSPVLIEAAQEALGKWKWQAAPEESHELVELSFHP